MPMVTLPEYGDYLAWSMSPFYVGPQGGHTPQSASMVPGEGQ